MSGSLKGVLLFSGALMLGGLLGAASRVSHASPAHSAVEAGAMPASMAKPAYDPKKKMPGDVCKSSDECQMHHTCVKVGDKQVCQAPPPPRLPPGAVT